MSFLELNKGVRKAPNEQNWAGYSDSGNPFGMQKRLLRSMVNTIVDYRLLSANDHIMVAISGGKDSYTLLELLLLARARAPFNFKITAVHLDQMQPGYDGEPLRNWLVEHKIDHRIIQQDTYSVVVDKTKPGGTFCALCSRLRRGALYTVADEIGANKIALGHHRDDALETLLLNLIYAGKLGAMPPKYRTDDGQFFVIRPLLEIAEADIARYAAVRQFPILPCNLCGSQEGLKRDRMTRLLNELEAEKPDVRAVMLNALKNVRGSHLMDQKYLDEDDEAPTMVRPRKLPILG